MSMVLVHTFTGKSDDAFVQAKQVGKHSIPEVLQIVKIPDKVGMNYPHLLGCIQTRGHQITEGHNLVMAEQAISKIIAMDQKVSLCMIDKLWLW